MEGAGAAQRARMARLAQQPHTDVLEYTYESPERDAPAVVVVKLATRAVEARKSLPKDLDVRKAARRVCKEDKLLEQFSRTHPQTFMTMMDMDNCGAALEMLYKLARLRQSVESGMSEAEANVHANRIIMEKTMRNPTGEEREKLVFSESPPAPSPQCYPTTGESSSAAS